MASDLIQLAWNNDGDQLEKWCSPNLLERTPSFPLEHPIHAVLLYRWALTKIRACSSYSEYTYPIQILTHGPVMNG